MESIPRNRIEETDEPFGDDVFRLVKLIVAKYRENVERKKDSKCLGH